MPVCKRRRVAILATVTDFGGAERVVLSLIRHLDENLFEPVPIIFTVPAFSDTAFFEKLNAMRREYYKVFVNNYKLKYLNPLMNVVEAYRLVRKLEIDLIHTHGYRADVLGIFLGKAMALPVVSTCHGFILNSANLKLYMKLDCLLLRFANRIMAVSDRIRSDMIQAGIKESRVTFIRNAVDGDFDRASFDGKRRARRQALGIKEDDFILGYIGRLSAEKGIITLIRAASLLIETGIPVKVLIVGEGPQRKELEALAEEKGLSSRILFAGFQPDIKNWLPALDIFVLPSFTEGTPMSPIEAMAYGLPAVASAVGGVPQVIDSGKNGILVPPGNPEEIRKAVTGLYKNTALRDSLSDKARTKMQKHYNIKDWIGKIETEYLKLIHGGA